MKASNSRFARAARRTGLPTASAQPSRIRRPSPPPPAGLFTSAAPHHQQILDRRDQRQVRRRHLVVAQARGPHPGQITALHRARRAFPFAADIDQHQKVEVVIGMAGEAQWRKTDSAVSIPSSSPSSRISAASGVSPGSTLPPGNSHSPAMRFPPAAVPAARGHRHRPAPRR